MHIRGVGSFCFSTTLHSSASLCCSCSPYFITTKSRWVSPVQFLPCWVAEKVVWKAKNLRGSHRSRRGLMEFIPPSLQAGLNKALNHCYSSQSAAALYMLRWFSIHFLVKSEMFVPFWLAWNKRGDSQHVCRSHLYWICLLNFQSTNSFWCEIFGCLEAI